MDLFSGRWTVEDSDLGHCLGYRGRPAISAVLAAVGVAICLTSAYGSISRGLPASSIVVICVMLPGVFWVLALANWRTEILVGDRGFRLERAWRPFQLPLTVPWSEVAACELGTQTDRRGTKAWLVVRRSSGEKFTVSQQFSAAWWEIRDVMEDRRKAALAAAG
jgi:hypothetical protein